MELLKDIIQLTEKDYEDIRNRTQYYYSKLYKHEIISSELTPNDVYKELLSIMASYLKAKGKYIEINNDVQYQLATIAHWLTGEYAHSSLLMTGSTGNGKTTVLQATFRLISQVNEKTRGRSWVENNLRYSSADEIIRFAGGDKESEKYFNQLMNSQILAIDDLGTESSEIIKYGNVVNPMVELLNHRYSRNKTTLISTNLRKGEISGKYGERILDRFREIMKVVKFDNPSFRQTNYDL